MAATDRSGYPVIWGIYAGAVFFLAAILEISNSRHGQLDATNLCTKFRGVGVNSRGCLV